MTQSAKPGLYRWVIASLGTASHSLQGGLIFWSMGIYAVAFEEHFQATRAKINVMETMLTTGVNALSPFIGFWVDKGSARLVVALGCLSIGIGFVLISFAGELFHIWLVFLLALPFGILALGVVPSAALITRWFQRQRGFALGLSVAGTSIGGFLLPPLITWLFATYGWRLSFRMVGIAVILLAPLFFLLIKNHPPQSDEEDTKDPEPQPAPVTWTATELLKSPSLWLQTTVAGCLLFITLGLVANLGFHAKDLDFSGGQIAVLFSITAMSSLLGKLIFGALIDQFGTKRSGALTIAIMISAMGLFYSQTSYDMVAFAAVIAGCGIGGVMPLWSSLVAEGFGAATMGRAMGIQNPLHWPITAPSGPLAGYISDKTGSYELVFVMYAVMAVAAGFALYYLKPPQKPMNKKVNTS